MYIPDYLRVFSTLSGLAAIPAQRPSTSSSDIALESRHVVANPILTTPSSSKTRDHYEYQATKTLRPEISPFSSHVTTTRPEAFSQTKGDSKSLKSLSRSKSIQNLPEPTVIDRPNSGPGAQEHDHPPFLSKRHGHGSVGMPLIASAINQYSTIYNYTEGPEDATISSMVAKSTQVLVKTTTEYSTVEETITVTVDSPDEEMVTVTKTTEVPSETVWVTSTVFKDAPEETDAPSSSTTKIMNIPEETEKSSSIPTKNNTNPSTRSKKQSFRGVTTHWGKNHTATAAIAAPAFQSPSKSSKLSKSSPATKETSSYFSDRRSKKPKTTFALSSTFESASASVSASASASASSSSSVRRSWYWDTCPGSPPGIWCMSSASKKMEDANADDAEAIPNVDIALNSQHAPSESTLDFPIASSIASFSTIKTPTFTSTDWRPDVSGVTFVSASSSVDSPTDATAISPETAASASVSASVLSTTYYSSPTPSPLLEDESRE